MSTWMHRAYARCCDATHRNCLSVLGRGGFGRISSDEIRFISERLDMEGNPTYPKSILRTKERLIDAVSV